MGLMRGADGDGRALSCLQGWGWPLAAWEEVLPWYLLEAFGAAHAAFPTPASCRLCPDPRIMNMLAFPSPSPLPWAGGGSPICF